MKTDIAAMSDEEILDYCDWLTDEDPIKLLRDVIPFLVHERRQYAEVAMQHQCTPDYEIGYLHGERATIQVCKQRYERCNHEL